LRRLSSIVNLIAVAIVLLTSGLHRCYQKLFKKNTYYFYVIIISISLAILSEILIQIGYFFKELRKIGDRVTARSSSLRRVPGTLCHPASLRLRHWTPSSVV